VSVGGFGSTQRMPGIGQEKPAAHTELPERWHSVARRVRWWIGIVSHLRTVIVLVVIAVVIGRRFGKLGLVFALVEVVGLIVLIQPFRRVAMNELRHATGVFWRWRWSAHSARVGLAFDGEAASWESPELRWLRVDELGRTYRLRVSRLKIAEVEAASERLRGKWKAFHVLVTVPRPGYVNLRVLKRDPLSVVTPYRPGRAVATLQDGRSFSWQVGGGSTLLAGCTGSGKSGVLAAIVASFADRDDVALLAIDLKRVEVAALRARCSKVATDLLGAHQLLTWLVTTMEDRWRTMEAEGVRTWQASASRPWLVLIVDEFASIAATDALHADQKTAAQEAAQRLGLVDALASRGRAAGIELLICTQSPAAELFGKTAIRSNLPRRAVARVVSADQAFVGLGVHGGEAELIDAGRPGTVKLIVPGLDGIATARFAYLSDIAVEAMARRTAHLAPDLDSAPPLDPTTAPGPVPKNSSPTTAPPSAARAEHNDRREAGATEPPRVYPQGVPSAAVLPDPLALIPVTDADLADYWRIPPDQRSLYLQLLAGSSGSAMSSLADRLVAGVMPNPTHARGENAPTFPDPTPVSGTPGQHPTRQAASDTAASVALIVPFDHPARTNPKTGRPYPASYRRRWLDGTLRNYPELQA
jgi:DNA segregation ATPase FtsK/SpoIIIE, S-DNA-T family